MIYDQQRPEKPALVSPVVSEGAREVIIQNIFRLSYQDMKEVNAVFLTRMSILEDQQPKKGWFSVKAK